MAVETPVTSLLSHPRPALSLTNEYSDTADERLYYKFFAWAKPACSIHRMTTAKSLMEEPVIEPVTPFAALIGIDWSDAKHDICLVETATGAQ